jgi:phospholipase D
VNVILDGGNLSDNKKIHQELQDLGINVSFDKMPGIAHNKVIIIDQSKVITGSYNFTNAADTRNAENVLLINDANIAKQYLVNWEHRKQHAK